MKLRSLTLAALIGILSTAIPSTYCSLKHTDSEAFVRLADLSRPDSQEKASSTGPLPSLHHTESASYAYSIDNVDWTATPYYHEQGKTAASGGHAADLDRDKQNAAGPWPSPSPQSQYSKFYPIKPPSIPLAVKSPCAYVRGCGRLQMWTDDGDPCSFPERADLNAWAPSGQLLSATPPNAAGNGGYLAGQSPSFWTTGYGAEGDYRLGWSGFIRVDNTTYQWMGNNFGTVVRAGQNANQTSLTYTSTRSIFSFEADGVHFNVTFMTPVWPNDYFRQSIPMSYMHFELDRSSAAGRSVQLFTDIDERWSSAHVYDYENYPINMLWVENVRDQKMNNSIYFVQRSDPQVYTEFRQRAEWGSSVYAMRKRPGMSSRNNNNIVAQFEFINKGNVTFEHNPVGGPRNSFAYTVDFDVKTGGDDALFGIGHVRSPYVNYIQPTNSTTNGTRRSYLEDRYGYWMGKYSNFQDLVGFFMGDFENALQHCEKLDAQIDHDSRAAVGGGRQGDMYSAITQLSVRQSFATLEITVPYEARTNSYNTSKPIIFLKEVSSNGDMQTVDVFTPQFPLLTYLNPKLLRDIMEPIFEYTESGLYPNKWCVHDLGVYPSAFGHNDGKDEPMQVEESGNMILLALHYAQLVGKKHATPWLRSHYKIMQQWAEFLVEDSLIPAQQLSTDDFAGTLANQTNLALKGIQGIAAMGEIASYLGKSKDAAQYQKTSRKYIQRFYEYSMTNNGSHVKLAYQDNKSWGTLYNLIFDRLLNLRLVAKELYYKQDAFYPTKANRYGTPLDSRYSWAKTDWQTWASATAANTTTRDFWIKNLYQFMSDEHTDAPFTDLYETRTGDFPKEPFTPQIYFIARPVVGGHFMHLALDKANIANNITEYEYGPPMTHKHKQQTGTQRVHAGASEDRPPVHASSYPPSRGRVAGASKQKVFGLPAISSEG